MKQPGHDVFLNDGCGYVVESAPYMQHLQESTESHSGEHFMLSKAVGCIAYFYFTIQHSSCANHKAVNQANANRKNLQATGVGACACARHGCFVPHSVVDFQKGERSAKSLLSVNHFLNSSRQINIDYAICHALGYNTHGLKEALIAYDVACQWSIHFDERVKQSPHLHLPQDLRWTPAVGKFHLAAHREQCFAHYSLNFVQGAGRS